MLIRMRHFSLLLAVALGFAWGLQTLHLVLVPHHYCASHEEFSHEEEHELLTSNVPAVTASETQHAHEHCAVLAGLLRHAIETTGVALARLSLTPEKSQRPVTVRLVDASGRYRLAPKNSPPALA